MNRFDRGCERKRSRAGFEERAPIQHKAFLMAEADGNSSFSNDSLWNRQIELVELPNPDVPEADRLARIVVCLQLDRRGLELLVKRLASIACLAL